MKELSIEQKAKAYDERLAKARKEYSIHEANNAIGIMDALERVFPELKESEDERIRGNIIATIHLYYGEPLDDEAKEMIAWLEKQGEEKSNPYSGVSFAYNGHTWGMCARDNGVEILIDGHIKGRVFTNDSNAKEMFIKALERVEEQNTKGYKLTDCDKNSWWEDFKAYASCSIEQKYTDKVEPKFHEGDMIIHKELGGDYIHNPHKIIQVDILDKKYRLEGGLVAHFGEQDDYELVEQKPAWSEEDEKMLNACTEFIGNTICANYGEEDGVTKQSCRNWLKFLKERYTWKPSDEQMRVLDLAIRCGINRGTTEETTLVSLFNDLKKLK